MTKLTNKIMSTGLKQGTIFGVKINNTTKEEVLALVKAKIVSKEKFYIVTPNPENLLIAKRDWLLKKAIFRSSLSVPDGIGIKFAFKFLYDADINIIKGRELFLDLIKLADDLHLKVCFVGGEKDEAEKAKLKLIEKYKNIIIRTYQTPLHYSKNAQPTSEAERKIHKSLLGRIKIYEPDLIFVALNTPKQEKWIYRNIYRINTYGAMTVGGTFNYIAGNMPYPPIIMEKLGLEWLWRVLHEPFRLGRIINAVIIFPWEIFLVKLLKKHFKS